MRKCFFKNWSEVEIFSFVRGRIDRSCFHNSRLHYYGTFYGSFLYSCRILCNHHDARLCIAHRLGSRRKRDEWIQEKGRNWNAFKDLLRYLSPFLPLLPFRPPPAFHILPDGVHDTKEQKRKRWSGEKTEKDAIEGVILWLIQHSLPKQLNTGLCLLTSKRRHALKRSFQRDKVCCGKLLIIGNPDEYKVRESSD